MWRVQLASVESTTEIKWCQCGDEWWLRVDELKLKHQENAEESQRNQD